MSDSATPWTVVRQDPLSMKFSWQEYWSGLPFPLPGDLPDLGLKHRSPAWQAILYRLSQLGVTQPVGSVAEEAKPRLVNGIIPTSIRENER